MLSASVFRSVGTQNFDNGSSEGISHTLDQSIGANLAGPITERGASPERRHVARGHRYARVRRRLPLHARSASGRTISRSAAQHVIAGFDFVHEHGVSIDTSGFGAPYDVTRDNAGAFGGWRVQDGAFDSELSGRYDHYGAFGSAFSGSAAVGWNSPTTCA